MSNSVPTSHHKHQRSLLLQHYWTTEGVYTSNQPHVTKFSPIYTEWQISRQALTKKYKREREKVLFCDLFSDCCSLVSCEVDAKMVHLPLSVQYLTVAWLHNGTESTETCSPLFELIITGPVRKKMGPISGENEKNYPDKSAIYVIRRPLHDCQIRLRLPCFSTT